jgi:type IX secretion system PorP/SprF family membrane protein
MKKTVFTICLLAMTTLGFGQYSLNLPSFNNSPILFNPAFAGNSGTLDASILHYSTLGIPVYNDKFSNLSVHAPIGKGNWGIGGNLMFNQLGYMDFSAIDGIVSYRKQFQNGAKLSFGGQASLERNKEDVTFFTSPGGSVTIDDSALNPQFGLGVLYESKYGYLSLSSTDMVDIGFTLEDNWGTKYNHRTENEFYISGGLNFEMLNGKFRVLPSATYHKLLNQELSLSIKGDVELGASFVLYDRVWFGGAYEVYLTRLNAVSVDYANAWVGVDLKHGLRVSGKIEWATTQLVNSTHVQGGLMLGYRFSKDNENLNLGRRNFF